MSVKCDRPGTLRVLDDAQRRAFANVPTIVQAYSSVLLQALREPLTNEHWFHGDLTSAESADLLAPNVLGTYLLRFRCVGKRIQFCFV
jgi:hypothetical protein